MSVLELGALGEFVAAFGVIASLIYVGFQVRQNTKATNGNAIAQVASEVQRNLVAVSQDDVLANAVTKVLAGEDLLPIEQTKLFYWFSSLLRGVESHVLQVKLGTLPDDHEEPWIRILSQLSGVPDLRKIMNQYIGTATFEGWLREHFPSENAVQ
jgi:hypothetical protein